MKALGYVRVSGQGQMDGDGPERQSLAIRAYARQNSLELVHIYVEAGVSGAKGEEDRPAFTDLLRDERATIVIFESLDRLARDLMMSETLLATLRRKGFDVRSTRDPDLCSDDPTRILIRQVLSAIAEWDRRVTVAKLRGARQRMKARTGRCEGRKPYGQHPDYPGEAEGLRLMRQASAAGLNLTEIAGMMNDNGIPTRFGCRWAPRTVQRILLRCTAGETRQDSPALSPTQPA